jgi:hypothetical protein
MLPEDRADRQWHRDCWNDVATAGLATSGATFIRRTAKASRPKWYADYDDRRASLFALTIPTFSLDVHN